MGVSTLKMNWYKTANLMEEIKNLGPNSQVTDIDDPRVEYIANRHGIDPELALARLQERGIGEFMKREFFTQQYSWSVPSEEAIESLKEFVGSDNVIEIGSGYGMWAKLMQDAGITTTPTDSFSDRGGYAPNKDQSFTDVEDLEGMKALEKYRGYNTLMMSWPPYDDPLAANALKGFSGNKLIFIGEGEGGCTGDDNFFEELYENWSRSGEIYIPQWSGINDYLSLWVRK